MKPMSKKLRALLLTAGLAICATSAIAQTATPTTTTHCVNRGETIQSIASKYGTTVAKIIELNPDAKEFIYVGMDLIVPVSVTANQPGATQTATTATHPTQSTVTYTADTQTSYEATEEGPGWDMTFSIEYGFIPKTKGAKNSTNYTYAATLGTNYYFLEKGNKAFAGVSLGYNSYNYHSSTSAIGSYETTESTAHCITIPIRLGYTIKTSNKNLGISPLIGFDANWIVKAKSKFSTYDHGNTYKGSSKEKKGIGFDFRAGVQLTLWSFNVGGSYIIPLDKKMKYYAGKEGYFAVNIGWGF